MTNRYDAVPPLRQDEDELDYAYIRDVESPGLRQTFVRLVRPGTTSPATTINATGDVELDLGPDGTIIGLTVSLFKDLNTVPLPIAGSNVTIREWLALEAEAAEHRRDLEAIEKAVLEAEANEGEVYDLERLEVRAGILGLRYAATLMGLEVGKDPENRDESKLLRNRPMEVLVDRPEVQPPANVDPLHARQLFEDGVGVYVWLWEMPDGHYEPVGGPTTDEAEARTRAPGVPEAFLVKLTAGRVLHRNPARTR